MRWPEIRELHNRSASELVEAAERCAAAAVWMAPRAEGKWSPAEIVEHLNLAYDALLGELDGKGGMRVRTSWWQRLLLRITLIPKLLRGGPFPVGARAPRETRPATANADPAAAIAAFRERWRQLDARSEEIVASGRRVRLTHAYFGSAPIPEAVLLCARHIQHHHKQLAAIGE